MKKKRFFVFGHVGVIGSVIIFITIVLGVILMSLQLAEKQGDYAFYIYYALIITLLIVCLISLPKLQVVIFNSNEIAVKNLRNQIVSVAWKDIKDFGVENFGVIKWIYVSSTILSEKEKRAMEITNRKNSFIRLIYNKKAYMLIKKYLDENLNSEQ